MAIEPEMLEQATQVPKKNKMKVIILAAVALIAAIVVSVAGTWFFLGRTVVEAPPVVENTAKQQAIYEDLEPAFVVNFKS